MSRAIATPPNGPPSHPEIDENARATALIRAIRLAPSVPLWFLDLLARTVAGPNDPDALLALADALEEAADTAAMDDPPPLARELRALADLPRDRAAKRPTWSPSCR